MRRPGLEILFLRPSAVAERIRHMFMERGAIELCRRGHKLHVHGAARYACDVPGCDAVLRTNGSLKSHRIVVHGTERFPCDVPGCKAVLKTKSSRAVHKRDVHETTRFPCSVTGCMTVLHSRRSLQMHKVLRH